MWTWIKVCTCKQSQENKKIVSGPQSFLGDTVHLGQDRQLPTIIWKAKLGSRSAPANICRETCLEKQFLNMDQDRHLQTVLSSPKGIVLHSQAYVWNMYVVWCRILCGITLFRSSLLVLCCLPHSTSTIKIVCGDHVDGNVKGSDPRNFWGLGCQVAQGRSMRLWNRGSGNWSWNTEMQLPSKKSAGRWTLQMYQAVIYNMSNVM